MKIFDGSRESSEEFAGWMINHPDSFVVNIRGRDLMLHVASCGHFKFARPNEITFAPKRASFDRQELIDWAKQPRGGAYRICSTCKP